MVNWTLAVVLIPRDGYKKHPGFRSMRISLLRLHELWVYRRLPNHVIQTKNARVICHVNRNVSSLWFTRRLLKMALLVTGDNQIMKTPRLLMTLTLNGVEISQPEYKARSAYLVSQDECSSRLTGVRWHQLYSWGLEKKSNRINSLKCRILAVFDLGKVRTYARTQPMFLAGLCSTSLVAKMFCYLIYASMVTHPNCSSTWIFYVLIFFTNEPEVHLTFLDGGWGPT